MLTPKEQKELTKLERLYEKGKTKEELDKLISKQKNTINEKAGKFNFLKRSSWIRKARIGASTIGNHIPYRLSEGPKA